MVVSVALSGVVLDGLGGHLGRFGSWGVCSRAVFGVTSGCLLERSKGLWNAVKNKEIEKIAQN